MRGLVGFAVTMAVFVGLGTLALLTRNVALSIGIPSPVTGLVAGLVFGAALYTVVRLAVWVFVPEASGASEGEVRQDASGAAMPAREPDRPVATLVLVLPVVGGVALLVRALLDGDKWLGFTAVALALLGLRAGVTTWRRYVG